MPKSSDIRAEVLSQAGLQRYLGVSGPTLRKAIREDKSLPHRRVGRRYVFSRSAIDKWLAGKDAEVSK